MAASSNKHDLPVLLSVLAHGSDHKQLEELMKNNLQKLHGNIGLSGLVSMLKALTAVEQKSFKSGSLPSLKIFTSAVLREAASVSQQKLLHSPDLQVIVAAAKKDRKALKRLLVVAASPVLLASVQKIPLDSPWKQAKALISVVLGPFVKARVEVPRLEATCASHLMGLLGRVCNLSDVCGFSSLLLQFRAHALLAMPSFLDVFTAKLGIVVSSPASSSDTGVVGKLCTKLLAVVGKTLPASSGDTELDNWVQSLEDLALDQFKGCEHDSGAVHDCIEKGLRDKFGSTVQNALGDGWLSILLVRCRTIVWLGGRNIRCEPPKPKESVKSLGQAAYSLLGAKARERVDALELEEEEDGSAELQARRRDQQQEESPGKKARVHSAPDATAKDFHIGDRVECRFKDDAWLAGVVTSLSPLKVRRDGAEVAMQWDEVRKEQVVTQQATTLVVKIGDDKDMGETLVGTYAVSGTNHGRNVYSRKEGDVLLFYWDDRDGEEQAGWWFGPEVGGEEVWAFHNAADVEGLEPPERGWTMLHSSALDPNFSVEALRGESAMPVERQQHGGNPQHDRCKSWLKELAGGTDDLLMYFDVLAAEFDADLSQIAAAKIDGTHANVLDYVDGSFWDTLAVDNLAHKLMFAKGMKSL